MAHSPVAQAADDAGLQFFENKVRPLLADRCYKCHSVESGKDKGGLLLDSAPAVLKGGDNGPAVVPGDPGKSKLIEAVSYQNVDLQMPPKGKLTDSQQADLTAWVKMGAPWPASASTAKPGAVVAGGFDLQKRKASHWAWQPIKAVEPPAVKDTVWAADPIDRFILAKLEEKQLSPAPRADPRALIRRATFDLIGLPPTPAEVEAFVNDKSPDAFAKVIDRLLASPAYGERWGRHWLDLVRYAESRGHEFDYGIADAFQYRDYVIRAINADVPYNQFVTEHLAGDLMPEPRKDSTGKINESVLATGFWFLGEWIHSPVDIRQDECDRVDNQIDVMGKAFLGLTIGCARCHDHKFDAIAAKDYYSLAGFLHSSTFREVRFENQDHNRDALRKLAASDDAARTAVLKTVTEAQKPTLDRLADYLLAAGAELRRQEGKETGAVDGPTARDLDPVLVSAWTKELKAAVADAQSPLHPFSVVATDKEEPSAQRMAEVLRTALPAKPADDTAAPGLIVDYDRPGEGNWITNGYVFGERSRAAGSITLGSTADRPVADVAHRGFADSAALDTQLPGMLCTPTFVIEKPHLAFRVMGKGQAFIAIDSHRLVEGPLHGVCRQGIDAKNGWTNQVVDLASYIGQRAHIEFTPAAGSQLAVRWVQQGDEKLPPAEVPAARVAAMILAGAPPQSLRQLAQAYQQLMTDAAARLATGRLSEGNDAGGRAILAGWMMSRLDSFGYGVAAREGVAKALAEGKARHKELLADYHDSPTAMSMLDGTSFDEHVLIRGSPKTPGDVAPRRFLEALAGPDQPAITRGSGRLELAQRMTGPSDPLVPRVMVNRIWHHLFGRGIVATTDNFGVLGDLPTHPELLDYLATRFTRDGWSVKRFIRGVMLSSAYQMASLPTDADRQLDPQNLLLSHQNVRRLEGEAIRDSILAISGRLDPKMYGPGIDIHLTDFMDGRGRPASGPLDGAGRRSLYLKIRRNFLSPMMMAFDTPQPFNCMGRRSVSNVPAQALILMNDPLVYQQAGVWAKRVLADATLAAPADRIASMYQSAYARPPTAKELAAATEFLDHQGEQYGSGVSERGKDLRVWTDLAHVLMNVKEFIFVK